MPGYSIPEYMTAARVNDRWIVLEHFHEVTDEGQYRVAFHALDEIFDPNEPMGERWVRWEEGLELATIHPREDVTGELREASAIQIRSSPPFHPEDFETV